MIYLDYAANYPCKKEVLEELANVELNFYGNANSLHNEGLKSKELFDKYNKKIFDILNVDGNEFEMVYTSSATESNNLAIKGICKSYSGFGKHILVSEFEHNSNNACLSFLKDQGYEVEFVNTLKNGQIDLVELKSKIRNDSILFVACLIESETGAIQNYKDIINVIKDFPNLHFLMDATQAIGKYNIDFNGLELVSFAPHKFGGLTGTGCLLKRKATVLTPLIHGGKSNSIYRSGSIPLGLIASSCKALEMAYQNINEKYNYVKEINEYFYANIKDMKNIVWNSFDNPYIINISILNLKASESVKTLNDSGFCVSQKAACSITNTPSKTIMAIYHDKKRALTSFRISICELTTKDEIDKLLTKLKEMIL